MHRGKRQEMAGQEKRKMQDNTILSFEDISGGSCTRACEHPRIFASGPVRWGQSETQPVVPANR